MNWMIPSLIAIGIATGPVIAKIQLTWLRRTTGWLVLVAIIAAAAHNLTGYDPILRMVGICSVLLGAMKGLVYAEWHNDRHQLSITRYLLFSFCWFGMDPGSFQTRRENLSWIPDIKIGLLLMLAGTIGAWVVWKLQWHQILVMFIPLSIGFHFGALRVLKGCLRAAGFPVRTLFPNVLEANGLGEFWSHKWNTGYSQMMQRTVGRPITRIANSNTGLLAIFIISGLLHELAITLPVQAGYGLPTAYFTAHGLLTLVERKWKHPIGKLPTLMLVAIPLGILFPPAFQEEIIQRCLQVFELAS